MNVRNLFINLVITFILIFMISTLLISISFWRQNETLKEEVSLLKKQETAEIEVRKEVISTQKEINNFLRKNMDKRLEIIEQTARDVIEGRKKSACIQGVSRVHLRMAIVDILKYLGEKDLKSWTDLLMITAQVESHLGFMLKQQGKGPAIGAFQFEPKTEKEIWKYWFNAKRNSELKKKVQDLRIPAASKLTAHEGQYNLGYSIAIAYSTYRWRGVKPKGMTISDMILVYKDKYNTSAGKAQIDEIVKKLAGSKILSEN